MLASGGCRWASEWRVTRSLVGTFLERKAGMPVIGALSNLGSIVVRGHAVGPISTTLGRN